MVAWFAGLFYLPRLFVYHIEARSKVEKARFCLMERRLYRAIMFPAAIATTLLGIWLIGYNPHYYLQAGWFHVKLVLVLLLWGFHGYCGYCVKQFAQQKQVHKQKFYRIINEFPTLFLIAMVLLVVVKPF